MVELRGVEAGFPLYGACPAARRAAVSRTPCCADRGALVRPELLTQLDLAGRRRAAHRLGRPFTIRGVVETEPGSRSGGFSLGPRVLIDRAAISSGRPARVRQPRATPDHAARGPGTRSTRYTRDLRQAFRNEFVNVRSWQSTESDIGEDLERSENYLSLVGLVVAGPWRHRRLERHAGLRPSRRSRASRCSSASARAPAQILGVYMLQVLALGLAGSLLGVALARAALLAVDPATPLGRRRRAEPLRLRADLAGRGAGRADRAAGVAAVLDRAAAAIPPRQAVAAPAAGGGGGAAATDLRRGRRGAGRRRAGRRWPPGRRGRWRVGLIVCAGFVGIAGVLLGAPAGCSCELMRPLGTSRWFALRHAALHLDRPGNQTRVILLAVGLGVLLHRRRPRAAGEPAERSSRSDLAADTPDMFLIDIQQDQADGLTAFLGPRVAARRAPRLLPVLRARVTGVRGREVTLDSVEDVRGRGSLAREYTSRTASALAANETVIEGRSGTPSPSAAARSVDRAEHSRAVPHPDRRHDALRCAGPAHRGARHQRARRGLARRRATAASCSCSGRAPSTRRRTLHRLDARAGRRRRSARASSATS